MQTGVTNSFVSGFNYFINNLKVEMNVVPFVMGQNQVYQIIRYKGRYNVALVRFTLSMESHTAVINIPFYQSTGSNSSAVGAGIWFPFHCCSQRVQTGPVEYYYRSEYGDSYFFKMGHYYPEPFAGKCDDVPRDAGIRHILLQTPQSTCSRQKNFMIEQTKEIQPELLHSESGQGVHTVLLRFGNLLYLTASYFLFGIRDSGLDATKLHLVAGNSTGWNPINFPENSPERAFALILNRISSRANFGGKKWNELAVTLPRTPFNPTNYYSADTSNVLNYLLAANNVPMPHYQEISRLDNGLDAKFVTCMKLLQAVGELYLDSNSLELQNRFKTVLIRAASILTIPLTTQDRLLVENDFYVWLLPECFSGNNTLVRLYRFM